MSNILPSAYLGRYRPFLSNNTPVFLGTWKFLSYLIFLILYFVFLPHLSDPGGLGDSGGGHSRGLGDLGGSGCPDDPFLPLAL